MATPRRNSAGFTAKEARGFVLEGVDQLMKALQEAGTLAEGALAAAMVMEQELVITEAKKRTPVDTGVLRASGVVLPPEQKGTMIEVVSGFGGAAAPYAIVVHEWMEANHPSGEAKFLEKSFNERSPKMPSNLAARIERAWQRLRAS